MLTLTRKTNETIVISDDIEVTIVKIGESSVKVCVNAPKNIKILRKELVDDVKNENKEAISISLEVLKEIK
ncbi:MAG: carbon storage regulator CsrA [Sarcina sp.]